LLLVEEGEVMDIMLAVVGLVVWSTHLRIQ
jgi:hypothetical protein